MLQDKTLFLTLIPRLKNKWLPSAWDVTFNAQSSKSCYRRTNLWVCLAACDGIKCPAWAIRPTGQRWSPILVRSARHQLKLQDHGHRTNMSHGVPVYIPACADSKLYCGAAGNWTNDLHSQGRRPNNAPPKHKSILYRTLIHEYVCK